MKTIPLGFEMGTGAPVAVPVAHMVVTGQTQKAGKTTALEALISRSELTAVAFVTKRGESGFSSGHRLPPCFEERADWAFVESILESVMSQRMKFERAWVVRACKGAKTLAEVQANVVGLMESSKRGMDKDIYLLLNEYLNRVVPLIRGLPKSKTLALVPGLNVIDLLAYPAELQSLVIASTIRLIHRTMHNTTTIIPEAWKFCPQKKNSPVKAEVIPLVREGAGLKNFVWFDSQDIAGVDKEVLRGASVWMIGVQREANEVARAIKNIPAGIRAPKPGDVARLGLGEFFVSFDNELTRAYVRPQWMAADIARDYAMGKISDVERSIKGAFQIIDNPSMVKSNPTAWGARVDSALADVLTQPPSTIPTNEKESEDSTMTVETELKETNRLLKKMLGELGRLIQRNPAQASASGPEPRPDLAPLALDVGANPEAIFEYIKRRLAEEAPAMVRLLAEGAPEIELTYTRPVIELDDSTLRGWICQLIARGFMDNPTSPNTVYKELKRLGRKVANPSVYNECGRLASLGILTKESDGYQRAPGLVVREKAR